MAERDQLVRALRGHHAGDDRGVEHRAFLRAMPARAQLARHAGGSLTTRLGAGLATRRGLGADVDHGGPVRRVEVREAAVLCGLPWLSRRCSSFRPWRVGGVAHRGAQLAVAVARAQSRRRGSARAAHRRRRRRAADARRSVPLGREQAGVERCHRRTGARASSRRRRAAVTEEMKPTSPCAVLEGVALAPLRRGSCARAAHRPARMDARRELREGTTSVGLPVVAVADVHVFDEAHDDAGAAEVLHQVEHACAR